LILKYLFSIFHHEQLTELLSEAIVFHMLYNYNNMRTVPAVLMTKTKYFMTQ